MSLTERVMANHRRHGEESVYEHAVNAARRAAEYLTEDY